MLLKLIKVSSYRGREGEGTSPEVASSLPRSGNDVAVRRRESRQEADWHPDRLWLKVFVSSRISVCRVGVLFDSQHGADHLLTVRETVREETDENSDGWEYSFTG